MTLQNAVLERLTQRSTWLQRGDIVQSLLLDPAYKASPALPLANAVSTALHEIKAGGHAVVQVHGTLRFWHYLPHNTPSEDIMNTFDPVALGFVEDKAQDIGRIMDKLKTRQEAVSPVTGENGKSQNEKTGIVEFANGEPIGIVGADTLEELARIEPDTATLKEAFDDAIGYEIEALQHRLDNPIQYVGPVDDKAGMVQALEGAARFFERHIPDGVISGKLHKAAELIRQLPGA